jgi:hypothetical protein
MIRLKKMPFEQRVQVLLCENEELARLIINMYWLKLTKGWNTFMLNKPENADRLAGEYRTFPMLPTTLSTSGKGQPAAIKSDPTDCSQTYDSMYGPNIDLSDENIDLEKIFICNYFESFCTDSEETAEEVT